MPHVSGESLRDRLEREQQLAITSAISIAREVADALSSAHEMGIVHRDIKPENILLRGNHALVADFGIALAVQQAGGARMTQTGLSLGTPQYMSPEQAMGERNIGPRSDIYSLGAVTYEMLTGDPPFSGHTVQAIVAKVMTERPTPPTTVRDTVPRNVEHAVLIALAKVPADRFATASEFAAALIADRSAEETRAVSHPLRQTPASARRSSVIAWAAAGIASIVAAGGWLRPQKTVDPVTRLTAALPPGQELLPQWRGYSVALSSDGTRLAYVGQGPTSNSTQLWVRPLDALEATAVPNTVGASTVRWVPEGGSLFFSSAQTGDGGGAVSLDGSNATRTRGSYDADVGSSGRVYAPGQGVITRQMPGGVIDTVARIEGM